MDSEEPPNVRVACSGDIDEVVRLMHDAAAWMSAKGTPAWDVARIDRTFAETFVLRSELLGRGLPLAKAVLDRLLYQRDVMNHWTLVSKRFGPGI